MPMERTLLDLWVQDVVLVCLDTASHYPVGGQGISEGFFSLFLRQISIQCISTACPSSWASFCHLDASSNRAADLENKFSISERMSQLERTQASFSITVSIFHFQMPGANGIVWMGWLMWQLHMWTCDLTCWRFMWIHRNLTCLILQVFIGCGFQLTWSSGRWILPPTFDFFASWSIIRTKYHYHSLSTRSWS